MSIRRLFRHMRRNRELDDEIKAHLAMATGDRVGQGEDPRTAKAAVQREFGNRTLVEEVTREQWGWSFLQTLWQDVQYAWRGLRRSPGYRYSSFGRRTLLGSTIWPLPATYQLSFTAVFTSEVSDRD